MKKFLCILMALFMLMGVAACNTEEGNGEENNGEANGETIKIGLNYELSGGGVGGMRELEQQVEALAKGEPVVCSTFPYQIAYNLIPQIGSFDAQGYSSEEMKLQNEGRKILHADNLLVTCTCVRVPVMRSHSVSVSLETEAPLSLEQVRHAIANSPGCLLVDDPANKRYPMPLDTSDQDLVYVGRIRRDLTSQTGGIALWCCGDQIRKGAATNAVQIAQLLIAQ